MPQDGQINEKFGVYKSVCCGSEIVMGAGATFPYCPDHRGPTIWKLLSDEDMTIRSIDKHGAESDPAA